jgi:alpha-amylase
MPVPTRRFRAFLGASLASGALVTAALVGAVFTGAAPAAAASTPPRGDVIANLFEWNWNSVATECTTVLGPNGYGAVQVAPPEESVTLAASGHPWWEVYQPVSYQVNSRMGNRAAFAAMVSTCHNAGIKVYADAVLNHMTGQNSAGSGYAGTGFTAKYTYPGTYGSQDFHHYPSDCPNSDGQIHDYNNQTDVQKCELVQLSDLRTESSYVRGKLAGYLNDLISLGVDGFRLDAAKHIDAADIAAIKAQLTRPAFLYQEVMPGGAVNPPAYESNGSVLEFTYGKKLKEQFQGSIANLQTFGQSWGLEPSAQSVTFVDNHDTDRDGSTLTYKNGSTYQLANVFSLAWGYGTPQVYSSFTFTNNDQSPPADASGFVTATDCGSAGTWLCQDRQQATLGMVGWHNAVAGNPVGNWWSDGGNVISFSRGSAGFVAINNGYAAVTRTFSTGMAAGTYCDVIHGTASGTSCSGSLVSVDSAHNATITVPAQGAVAFDSYSTASTSSAVAVTFSENASTTFGQNVFVVGDNALLGSWNTNLATALSSAGYPVWSTTVWLPKNTAIQYKCIKKNPDGTVTWEGSSNRSVNTGSSATLTLNDSWR